MSEGTGHVRYHYRGHYLNMLKSKKARHFFTHFSIMTTMRAVTVKTDEGDPHGGAA
jgi:hypothetical protein